MILKLWKELRIQNQLLIIQILFASVIFAILISACVYLVNLFSVFIQQELLQQLVLSSVVSTIEAFIIRVDMIGMVVYNQYLASRFSLQQLFEFQVENKISAYSYIDDCLKSNHSEQFYSYQFCYGLYGQEQNSSDFTQIHNFTNLQNQFVPFLQRKLVPTSYNIKFGERVFLSQYLGQFLQQIDQQLFDALQQMDTFQETAYFQQQLNYTGKVFLQISSLGNQMYLGALLNQSENPYTQLTQSGQYYNMIRLYIVKQLIVENVITNGSLVSLFCLVAQFFEVFKLILYQIYIQILGITYIIIDYFFSFNSIQKCFYIQKYSKQLINQQKTWLDQYKQSIDITKLQLLVSQFKAYKRNMHIHPIIEVQV